MKIDQVAGARRALAVAVAAASMVPVAPVFAAEQQIVEEVVVTGSRVQRRELATPAPISVVDADAVIDSGETDIAKLLRETPALNGSLTGTNSTNTGFDSDLGDDTGVGRLNLRNLGTNRTLVLVNGRRHVSAIQGSADVDIGSIPISLIERVETLTGGSSAVYGADAVTGVVNFILRDDFEGVDYRTQYSLPGEGDGENFFASLTAGTNFADGRGNLTASFEYTNQRPVRASDRSYTTNEGTFALLANSPELSQAFGRNPNAAQVFVPDFRINFSSSAGILALREAGAGGSVFGGIVDGDADAGVIPGIPALQVFDGSSVRAFDRGIESTPFETSGGDGIETVNPNEFMVPEIERYNLNLIGHYELVGGWEAFAEVKYVAMETVDSDGIPFNDDIPIALDNAFLPADLQAQIAQAQANGFSPALTMSRDILDRAVIPTTLSDRDTFRLVGGLRKEFDNGLFFETFYNYGRTDIDTTERNSRVEDRFFAAVDAVVDPASGDIVCRSDLDPTATPPLSPFPAAREGFLTFEPGDGGCTPINLFGTDSITSDAVGFAFIDALARSEIEQEQFLAVLSGDSSSLFTLPAGPVGFAVGYEYRKEESSFTPPELERAGLLYNTLGEARSNVDGAFDVKEGFAELSVPLLTDLPLIEELSVDGSYRFTDHSTAGSIETYGFGGVWQPVFDLRVRGSYNRAVRAPNIFELFSPAQPSFLGVTADPCNPQNIGAGTEFREQNCLQFVQAGFDAADFLSARTAGTTGGNPALDAEKADTFTFGVVFQPRWVDGLLLTVDYYSIEIEDAIDSLSGADIAELCVDLPSIQNQFCNAIVRDPARGNAIVDFTSGNVNLGAFETDGIDLTATWEMSIDEVFDRPWGELRHSLSMNHVLGNSDFPDPLDPGFELPREGQLGIPEWIVNYNLGWEYDRVTVNWQFRWQDSQLNAGVTNEDVAGNPQFADPLRTGSELVQDFSFRYSLTEQVTITGGVNNLTDKEPFLATRTRPVDAVGRTFFLGLQGSL